MADKRIFWTIFLICGYIVNTGHGITPPPTPTNKCVSENVRGYLWNETDSGTTASQPCQSPYNRGNIFRSCNSGTWSEPEYSTCKTVAIANRNIIHIIQYICCGTTIFNVLLALFILVFAWRNAGAETTIVEISFGLAIIATNVAFLAGVNNTANEMMCKATAVCLHYLPTVTVFHVFAIMFHLSTLRFQTSTNSYCCLLFSAWGLPAIIVGLYGYFTMLEEYGNPQNCWLLFSTTLFWVYYGTLMSICGLIFLSLLGVIYRSKLPGRGPKLGSVLGAIPIFIVFITTLMTWTTGVLSVNEYNDGIYLIQIVFGVLNILQGLVYLIVFGIMGTRARKEKVYQKSKMSRLSQPTVSTYTGYRDDHVRNWSYRHHLRTPKRAEVLDFYSTDEEVQQRYLDRRRNNRDEIASSTGSYGGPRGEIHTFQNNVSERQGDGMVVVHKEVVPQRLQAVVRGEAGVPQEVATRQQQEDDEDGYYRSTSSEDEDVRLFSRGFDHVDSVEVIQQQRHTESPEPTEGHEDRKSNIFQIPIIVTEQSLRKSQMQSQSEDGEGRPRNDDEDDVRIQGIQHPVIQQQPSPVTQRTRNTIDPPAPSRISAAEIETFTIDVPEENTATNQSDDFILQDEGEVVMEYRNSDRAYDDVVAVNINPGDASDNQARSSGGSFFQNHYGDQSHLEPPTDAFDDTESHTGSMIVYQVDEGNTNGITKRNESHQADEFHREDSDYTDVISSAQPTPLVTDTEEQPGSSYEQYVNKQLVPHEPDVSDLRQQLRTYDYPDEDDDPSSTTDINSSFLDRLRKQLRPVSTAPRELPPERVPEPVDPIQSEETRRRQWTGPDEDLALPPTDPSPTPEQEERPKTSEPQVRPPTPPPIFIPPPPPLEPPPPSLAPPSPYGKRVSFANNDTEISSHL